MLFLPWRIWPLIRVIFLFGTEVFFSQTRELYYFCFEKYKEKRNDWDERKDLPQKWEGSHIFKFYRRAKTRKKLNFIICNNYWFQALLKIGWMWLIPFSKRLFKVFAWHFCLSFHPYQTNRLIRSLFWNTIYLAWLLLGKCLTYNFFIKVTQITPYLTANLIIYNVPQRVY